jgi:sterol desaturase/sphingolipid hydroxylase (fatty acid hydroxylase superfamily)
LYQRFHEGHHAIRHVYDDYDGYYIDFFETLAAATIAYIPPVFLISRTHVLAVIFYVVLVAFVVFSVNHCGRELCIAINIPFVGTKLVLYHTQHHDDHHVYRQGNYAECLPFWDDLFGSRLVIRKRRPLPAQRLWNKAQKILTYIEVVNAIMNTKKETD